MRRGGRTGVEVFRVPVLSLSKGLLILDRGAKIPVTKKKGVINVYKLQDVGLKIYR